MLQAATFHASRRATTRVRWLGAAGPQSPAGTLRGKSGTAQPCLIMHPSPALSSSHAGFSIKFVGHELIALWSEEFLKKGEHRACYMFGRAGPNTWGECCPGRVGL